MDREEWQIHLDVAERCVAEGLAQIEKQQAVIQGWEHRGHDTTRAKEFLAALFESQGAYERRRDTLRQETELKPPSDESPQITPAL